MTKTLRYFVYSSLAASLLFGNLAFGQLTSDRDFKDAVKDGWRAATPAELKGLKPDEMKKMGWTRFKGSTGTFIPPVKPAGSEPAPKPAEPKPAEPAKPTGATVAKEIKLTKAELVDEISDFADDAKKECPLEIEIVEIKEKGLLAAGFYLQMKSCKKLAFIPLTAETVKQIKKEDSDLSKLLKLLIPKIKAEAEKLAKKETAQLSALVDVLFNTKAIEERKYYYEFTDNASLVKALKEFKTTSFPEPKKPEKGRSPIILPPIMIGTSRAFTVDRSATVRLQGSGRVEIRVEAKDFEGKSYSGGTSYELRGIHPIEIKAPAGVVLSSYNVIIVNNSGKVINISR